MASRITTQGLIDKCRRFLITDRSDNVLDELIKDAIISADRELRECDCFPLAWDIMPYDGLRTVAYANISAITAADPGVFTADSVDSDVTGHGFHDHSTIRDIVTIDGLDAPEDLNGRQFLLQYLSATTFSLKTLDGLDDIDTSSLDAYTSGGSVYHSGFVLNTTAILTNVDSQWTFKRVIDSPTFDGHPTDPISENEIRGSSSWIDVGYARRPIRYRYWQNMTNPTTPTVNHYLFWYPAANDQYNVFFNYQKEIADISTWTTSAYPYHPPEVHEYLWHGALAKLHGNAKRMQRSSDKTIATQIEVMFAQKWVNEWENDKMKTRRLNRKMHGANAGRRGISA